MNSRLLWFTVIILVISPFGCSSDKKKSPPKPPVSSELKAVKAEGTVSEIYARLLTVGFSKSRFASGFSAEEWDEIISGLKAAPDAEPPKVNSQSGRAAVFWSIILADLRGGPWQERLSEIYRTSSTEAIYWTRAPLKRLDKFNSRRAWAILESCEGHPELGWMWTGLASEFAYEIRKSPPDPSLSSISLPPGMKRRPRSYYKVPDWGYLNSDGVWKLVTREPKYFAGKSRFVGLLDGEGVVSEDMEVRLKDWLIKTATPTVEPLLRQLMAGKLPPREFEHKIGWDYDSIEVPLLREWMKIDPASELGPAVAQWLMIYNSEDRPSRAAGRRIDPILAAPPKWVAVFPELKEIKN